ncbi:MAG: acyl-CoA dehydrogenase family protein [Alphaproteobacteria bacterium]|nr:acyl-CoA dehydrogenase family protein [Alphaproteobacteria bacterium]MBU2084714.1 acyl-CoA dehydrogenase family protein [Alphaproteobacteria bacterium]MBU2144214.1 acyl-CoA dehydrogenase family protein [Alphaproteobacteria bacterium]MBU2198323.1 acyl-CoA dehydrogenase family protein [Alphaproteobacteria bacterium]
MNLTFSPETEVFRAKVRAFFESDFPADIIAKNRSGKSLTTEDIRRSEMALGAKGWLASAWPEEYGGPGWSVEEQYVFDEELERAGVPTVTPMGVVYVGPVLYTFASDEQKAKWLPGIRDGSVGWAQGYSEPGAGSDLASLQFSATLEDGTYTLNGHKIWTSAAQHADWIFLLARTSSKGKKQEGISFICCPMDAPGVTLVPIITIDGKHVLNEVLFDNVKVPEDYRIGEEGKGWTYSQYLLGFERTSYARIGGKRAMLRHARELANAIPNGGNHRLIDEPAFARKLTDAEMAVDGLEMTVFRVLSGLSSGGSPGDAASTIKILATQTHQQITELFLDTAAAFAQPGFSANASDIGLPPYAAKDVSAYFAGRAQSIYGGTNEIQRTIIARKVLGL